MGYFMINGKDYSLSVNALTVNTTHKYNSQTNAAGDTVVDYIKPKRTIEVGFIPLNSEDMKELKTDLDTFNLSISFRNPNTGELEENVNCIIPQNGVNYYTIRDNKVLFNAFNVQFIEL